MAAACADRTDTASPGAAALSSRICSLMPQFLASRDMSATGAVSRALPPRPSFAPFLHSNFLSQPPHLDPSLCLSPPPHVPLWPGLSCPASVTWGVFPLLGHLGWAPSRAVTGGLPGQSWDFLCELQSARSFLMPRRHFKVKHVSADSFRLAPPSPPCPSPPRFSGRRSH